MVFRIDTDTGVADRHLNSIPSLFILNHPAKNLDFSPVRRILDRIHDEMIKGLKEQIATYEAELAKLQEYTETLEEAVALSESTSSAQADVMPYVAEMVTTNPKLKAFQEELLECKNITEVRNRAAKYNTLGEKVRLDVVPTHKELTESLASTSTRAALAKKGYMI